MSTAPGLHSNIKDDYFTIDGLKHHYLLGLPTDGNIKGTVFLVHGWPDFSYGWRKQFEPLMDLGLRVVAMDCVGYAGTDAPAVPPKSMDLYSFKQAAKNIYTLATHLGAESIILGGHDWGAAIAYRTFQFYPEFVTHLFTLCVPYIPPAKTYSPLEDFVKALPNFKYQLQFASGELEKHFATTEELSQFINTLFGGVTPDGEVGFASAEGIKFDVVPKLKKTTILTEEELAYYAQTYAKRGLQGPCNWYRNRKENFENDKDLPLILNVPTLFIAALNDPTVPPQLYANMDKLVPNLTIRKVHAGHWAMAEDPKGVNAHLYEWITEVFFGGKQKL